MLNDPNAEWNQIVGSQVRLMERVNSLHLEVQRLKHVDRMFPMWDMVILDGIRQAIDEINAEWIEWNTKALVFLDLPAIPTRPAQLGLDAQFLHAVIQLSTHIQTTKRSVEILAENFLHIREARENQRNFNIAIASALASAVSLVATFLMSS